MPIEPVPGDTTQAARRSFKRKPNVYVKFADLFRDVFDYTDFSEMYSNLGQSAIHPVRLLFLLMVQFIEGLSDREVMEALAARIDLKYLLALPLDHEGYDYTVLCEMRNRMIEGNLERLLLDKMLECAEQQGLLKTKKQRTDSTIVLSAARRLSRVELVIETLTHALDVLTEVMPKLVLRVAATFEQCRAYEISTFQFRIPKKDNERRQLAEAVGRDGFKLLAAIDQSAQSSVLSGIPAVNMLRIVWQQQFDASGGNGPKFRDQKDLMPSADLIGSPHDSEARYTAKRDQVKFGFGVQVTETCVKGAPNLITNVSTAPATTADSTVFVEIARSLRQRGLKPDEHFVDAGYSKAENMLKSREQYDTEVVGPLQAVKSWQTAAAKGFDISCFLVDWQNKTVTCPQGKCSKSWRERPERSAIEISFCASECLACPVRAHCTKSESLPRKLELKNQSIQVFSMDQREYQKSVEFKKRYASRAGIEGTMSGYHANRGGRSPYMGLTKTNFRNLMIAGAINAVRLINHLFDVPLAQTRVRRFGRLMALVAA